MDDTIEERLAAVERALTDDDHDLSALGAEGETAERLRALEEDLDTLRDTVAELEAATQALRGYVGNVKSVNDDVRERADLALETAERAEKAATTDAPSASEATTDSSPGMETGRETEPRQETEPKQEVERPRDHDPEPTLELGADEDTQHRPTATSSTDRCPLCDGDAEHRRDHPPGRQTGSRDGRDLQAHGSRHGLTDGGLVPAEDESGADDTDATVLTRIRALL